MGSPLHPELPAESEDDISNPVAVESYNSGVLLPQSEDDGLQPGFGVRVIV